MFATNPSFSINYKLLVHTFPASLLFTIKYELGTGGVYALRKRKISFRFPSNPPAKDVRLAHRATRNHVGAAMTPRSAAKFLPAAFVLAAALAASAPAAPPHDASLQRAADAAMSARPGSLVVMDVVTGAILAAHNLNAAEKNLERPGSTLKPFVLDALLDSGKLDSNQRILCRRKFRIGSVEMDCTHPASITELNAESAIAYSCNTYVATVAQRLTATELVDALRRAGLDSPTGLAAGESVGHIAVPANQQELQLEALGSRGIEVTPIRLLESYRQLALRKRTGDLGADAPVFAGLDDSVAFGMAHASFVPNMKIAGKTGTAASPNTLRTHGFFVGYAPADKPEIVLIVFLDQGRGMDAAAVAQSVFAAFAREPRPQ
jgi:cell division protein FtsI/penicillin-binding protein 2